MRRLRATLAASLAILTLSAARIVAGCAEGSGGGDGGPSEPTADAASRETGAPAPAALEPAAVDAGCAAVREPPCRFHCTGYVAPKKLASTARTDAPTAVAWSIGDGGAVVTLKTGEESAFLDATDFELDVPDDKTTYGIAVELTRRAEGPVVDSHLTLLLTNAKGELPVDHRNVSPWPKLDSGVHHYGQCSDSWTVDLNPVDVRKPEFGARLSVKRGEDAGDSPVTARVGSMRVAVCYCNADGR